MTTAAASIKAKHREIAIRYRQGKKPFSMAAIRCTEISRVLVSRYGRTLPNDDAGRDDARIMAHHLAMMSDDQRKRVTAWLTVWAPWMTEKEMVTLIDAVVAKPLRWRADKLAARLNLTEAERTRLGIRTIGAVDVTKAEREVARQARKRQAKREQRRKQGLKPRAEYLATSAERTKPWEAAGCSRATWYRRQHQAAR